MKAANSGFDASLYNEYQLDDMIKQFCRINSEEHDDWFAESDFIPMFEGVYTFFKRN